MASGWRQRIRFQAFKRTLVLRQTRLLQRLLIWLTWSAALWEVSVCSPFALRRFIRSVFAVALLPTGAVGAQSQAASSLPGRCLQVSLALLQAPLPCDVHYAVPFLFNTTAPVSVNGVNSEVQYLRWCRQGWRSESAPRSHWRTLNTELIERWPGFKVTNESEEVKCVWDEGKKKKKQKKPNENKKLK